MSASTPSFLGSLSLLGSWGPQGRKPQALGKGAAQDEPDAPDVGAGEARARGPERPPRTSGRCRPRVRERFAVTFYWQAPLTQLLPAAQTLTVPLPQPPQFRASVVVLMQAPLQTRKPLALQATQALLTHCSVARQVLPQLPQFVAEVERLTQVPGAQSVPLKQAMLQAPPTQACPRGQALRQAPQFCASVARLAR